MSSNSTDSETKSKQDKKTHAKVTLDSWVEDRKNKDCVKCYKANMSLSSKYPELRSDGFFLLMQTKPQVDLMKKHCEKHVCIDKQKSGKYEVLTLIVIDNLGHSFPCASVFTDKVDQSVVEAYFTEIKSEIGNVNVKLLMTGKDEFISEAWSRVIGKPEKIACNSWETLKELRLKLNDLVQDKVKQSIVFKQLKALLNESDQKIFTYSLNKLISELVDDVKTAQFGLFISGNYTQNLSSWAPCFFLEESFKSNYEMESMHETFKQVLENKTTRRIDRALSNILEFLRSKVYDRLLLMSGGKTKLFNLSQKHNLAQKYIFKVVQKENYWIVFTLTGKKDKQKIRFGDRDCKCVQKCQSCQVCSHVYICSCPDSNVRLNMCRHIHGLCMQLAAGNIEHSTSDSDESDTETANLEEPRGLENCLYIEADGSTCHHIYIDDSLRQYEVVCMGETTVGDPYYGEHSVSEETINSPRGEIFQDDIQDMEQTTSGTLSLESMKVNLEYLFKTVLNSASNSQQLQEIENTLFVLQGKIQGVKSSSKSRKRLTSKPNVATSNPQELLQESCGEGKKPRK